MSRSRVEFADWFREESLRLRALGLREAVNAVHAEIKKVDAGLGVEMADAGQLRELILSAEGNPQLFELVRGLREALGEISSWAFTALKPPRGFAFTLTTPQGGRIEASELFFEPLQTDEQPPCLGIRVFLPPEFVEQADVEWMLRVAAETGIGEELCAEIGFFEAAPLTDTLDDPLPIEALGDFVVHFLKVTRSTAP